MLSDTVGANSLFALPNKRRRSDCFLMRFRDLGVSFYLAAGSLLSTMLYPITGLLVSWLFSPATDALLLALCNISRGSLEIAVADPLTFALKHLIGV